MSVQWTAPSKKVESADLMKRTSSNITPHDAKTPRGIRRRLKKHGKT
jgi:hypothetical protein